MPSLIQRLRARDLLHSLMPGTEELLQTSPIKVYMGIDPTAPSLHIGNLATLILLKHLQRAGHQPVVLLGGATAMIGDPSFKARERKLLARATVEDNQAAIERQIAYLFPEKGANEVQIINNNAWLEDISLLSFLRDVGKHTTINYMMAKDAIKTRVQTGISYTEFAYPLLQAYDFYILHTKHDVKLQLGGSDQWGNIIAGVDLIRKKAGTQAFGLTAPLLIKADGSKFGKTEQGNVWLDPSMTSPYTFYQFWINCADKEVASLLKKLTFLDLGTIQNLVEEHAEAPHKRLLQKTLAQEMTTMVHGQKTFEKVRQASELLFGGNNHTQGLGSLDEAMLLQALAHVPQLTFTQEEIRQKENLLELLCHDTQQPKIFSSKRDAREKIQAGGLRINQKKRQNPFESLRFDWLFDKYLIVQKGKKHYYLIRITT